MTGGNDKAELVVIADWQRPDGSNLLLEETRFVFSGQGRDRSIERIQYGKVWPEYKGIRGG
jgi:hypothetical protein